VHYLVTGVDGPSFGEPDDVNGLHQDYMDGWADRMIARGPSVSPDGTLHTGSVHIIDLPDLATADRFAHDEPYAKAGWFSTVTINPIIPSLDGTMWDRLAPTAAGISALVTSSLTDNDVTADGLATRIRAEFEDVSEGWIYVGVVCTGESNATGVMALIDEPPADAQRKSAAILDRAGIGTTDLRASRWRRGGR
jgi:uncharacterized protein YciI